MNDDTRKDVQSWKFVTACDMAVQMNGFVNLDDFRYYLNDPNINLDEVKIPIHYDQIKIEEEESFFQDCDSDNAPNTRVLNLQIDSAYSDEMEMSVLEFIQFHFALEQDEILEILNDFNER